MGATILAAVVAGCGASFEHSLDLQHATARAPSRTDPARVQVLRGEPEQRYHVLGDLLVVLRFSQSLRSFDHGEAELLEELRSRAGALGADAVILVRFGEAGQSFWGYQREVRARAVRY